MPWLTAECDCGGEVQIVGCRRASVCAPGECEHHDGPRCLGRGACLERSPHRNVDSVPKPSHAVDGNLRRCLNGNSWALNSAVECHLHTVEVTGSNPVAPTITSRKPSSSRVLSNGWLAHASPAFCPESLREAARRVSRIRPPRPSIRACRRCTAAQHPSFTVHAVSRML